MEDSRKGNFTIELSNATSKKLDKTLESIKEILLNISDGKKFNARITIEASEGELETPSRRLLRPPRVHDRTIFDNDSINCDQDTTSHKLKTLHGNVSTIESDKNKGEL